MRSNSDLESGGISGTIGSAVANAQVLLPFCVGFWEADGLRNLP